MTQFLLYFLVFYSISQASAQQRAKQKFIRLPSGLTFPAEAASNFQRDAYLPATFSPPSEKILQSPPRYESSPNESPQTGLDYFEHKKAMNDYVSPTPPPLENYQTIPPVTAVHAPAMPPVAVEATTVSTGPATTPATVGFKKGDIHGVADNLYSKFTSQTTEKQTDQKGHTFTALGGGQFYQSLFGAKNGFSPLNFFLNGGLGGGGRGGVPGGNNGFFVPVPVVIPPPPPPPPGPKCFTNPSGFLCCNVTLERTMEEAYIEAKKEGLSLCNVQKMATAVQEKAEKKFGTTFESVAAHKDFVAKINFAGDLTCKIEIDGKFIMAYATPLAEQEVNIVDANAFFSGTADQELDLSNGTKPTYIVYGPIK